MVAGTYVQQLVGVEVQVQLPNQPVRITKA